MIRATSFLPAAPLPGAPTHCLRTSGGESVRYFGLNPVEFCKFSASPARASSPCFPSLTSQRIRRYGFLCRRPPLFSISTPELPSSIFIISTDSVVGAVFMDCSGCFRKWFSRWRRWFFNSMIGAQPELVAQYATRQQGHRPPPISISKGLCLPRSFNMLSNLVASGSALPGGFIRASDALFRRSRRSPLILRCT